MFKIMIINILVYLNSSIYSASILAHEKFIFRKTLDLAVTILQPISVLCLIKGYPRASTIVIIQLILNIIPKTRAHSKMTLTMLLILWKNTMPFFIGMGPMIFWKIEKLIRKILKI